MPNAVVRALRDQIRGVTGGLLVVGVTFHYTMETWWWGWTLPLTYLVGYALVGLTLIMVITRRIGFHKAEQNQPGQSNPWWDVSRSTENQHAASTDRGRRLLSLWELRV